MYASGAATPSGGIKVLFLLPKDCAVSTLRRSTDESVSYRHPSELAEFQSLIHPFPHFVISPKSIVESLS